MICIDANPFQKICYRTSEFLFFSNEIVLYSIVAFSFFVLSNIVQASIYFLISCVILAIGYFGFRFEVTGSSEIATLAYQNIEGENQVAKDLVLKVYEIDSIM